MRLVFAACAVICLLSACDDDNSPASSPRAQTRNLNQINWVGMSTVFDDVGSKRDYSVVFITASWCSWCTKLKNETLCNAAVQDELNQHYNPVLVDVTVDSMVTCHGVNILCENVPACLGADRYGFPCAAILNRAGTRLSVIAGYRDADDMLYLLKSARTP